MLVFLSASGPHCHNQWPLSSRATVEEMKMCSSLRHCFHYEEIAYKLVLVKITIETLFSCPVNWGNVFLRARSDLITCHWAEKAETERATAGVCLKQERKRWIIHPFSQSCAAALEARVGRCEVENEESGIHADVKQASVVYQWSSHKHLGKQHQNRPCILKVTAPGLKIMDLWWLVWWSQDIMTGVRKTLVKVDFLRRAWVITATVQEMEQIHLR